MSVTTGTGTRESTVAKIDTAILQTAAWLRELTILKQEIERERSLIRVK